MGKWGACRACIGSGIQSKIAMRAGAFMIANITANIDPNVSTKPINSHSRPRYFENAHNSRRIHDFEQVSPHVTPLNSFQKLTLSKKSPPRPLLENVRPKKNQNLSAACERSSRCRHVVLGSLVLGIWQSRSAFTNPSPRAPGERFAIDPFFSNSQPRLGLRKKTRSRDSPRGAIVPSTLRPLVGPRTVL
jgi:hypothetical protein